MMTKKKPILFSTPMVQATLDGRKTQTRRVMKPADPFKARAMGGYRQGNGLWIDGYKADDPPNDHIKDYSVSSCWMRKGYYISRYAPYKPGDILWVRETWSVQDCEKCLHGIAALGGECKCEYAYRANYGTTEDDSFPPSMFRWRPSIHMPREAARIFLRVTDVRVERLKDISLEDVIAEGFQTKADYIEYVLSLYPVGEVTPESWFWVYTFERIEEEQFKEGAER